MKWDLIIAGAIGGTALIWAAASPRTLELQKAAGFLRPVVPAATADKVERLNARLEHASGLGLFPLSLAVAPTGPSPAAASLRLKGTSIGPRRRAALIAIDGASAHWIAIGEAGDLQLIELTDTRALVRITSGEVVELSLFKAPETNVAEASIGNE